MSANGALDQRSGFQRWVASLKRENQTHAVGAAPIVPAPLLKPGDDATRVHRIPKHLLLRLQAHAPSAAVEAERTAVFHVPPELLERSKGALPADEAADDVTRPGDEPTGQPAAAGDTASFDVELHDSSEARSGISTRPQGLVTPPHSEPETFRGSEGAADPMGQEPSVDEAPKASALLAEAALNADVDALLSARPARVEATPPSDMLEPSDRVSELPQFQTALEQKLVFVVAILSLAALLFLALR